MSDKTIRAELDALDDQIQATGNIETFSVNGVMIKRASLEQQEKQRTLLEQKLARRTARHRTRPDFS